MQITPSSSIDKVQLASIFMRMLAGVVVALLAVAVPASATSRDPRTPPHNPYVSRGPDATMHGDSEASDTFGVAGPGRRAVTASYQPMAADCPTVLIGSDGLIQAVCVNIATRSPSVFLIDPATTLPVATMSLAKGGLLGGIYSYLDQRDRLVISDGSNTVQVIGHSKSAAGTWSLRTVKSVPLSRVVPSDDSVVGLSPDWQGRTWFASAHGVVGFARVSSSVVRAVHLPHGETVANSIASAPSGVAVASTKALYAFRAVSNSPHLVWRHTYDRGSARKPGQLSWGTGATPTYFGPRTGAEYLAITDNADKQERLLVYSASSGARVCRVPVLSTHGSGTENSPIGYGHRVYVADTYGYPYPAYPDGAGDSKPATAPFRGGLTHVDVTAHGCSVKWTRPVRSASVPKLSRADGLIYTTMRTGTQSPSTTSDADRFDFVAVNARTGKVVSKSLIGYGTQFDPIQQAGALSRGGAYYQGVLTGLLRIAP